MGGDLRALNPPTLALLTNDAVLAVNQRSSGNRPLFERDGLIGWCADVPGTRDRCLALFNTRDRTGMASETAIGGALESLGLARARARDLWSGADLGPIARDWAPTIAWHGAGLYRLAAI